MSEEIILREIHLRERLGSLQDRQTRFLHRLWQTSETMEPKLTDENEIQDILNYYQRKVEKLRDTQIRARKTIWECRTLKKDPKSQKEWDRDDTDLEKKFQERRKLQRIGEYQAKNFQIFKRFEDVDVLLKRAEKEETTYEEFKQEELESFLAKGLVKVILWKETNPECKEMVKKYEQHREYRVDAFFSYPDSEPTRKVAEKVYCNLYIVREFQLPRFTKSDADEILTLAHCYTTGNEFFKIGSVEDKIGSVEDGSASVDVHLGSDDQEAPWWQAFQHCQPWDRSV